VLRLLGRRLRIGSLERGDFTSERPVENVEALAAAGRHGDRYGAIQLGGNASYPPGYVKAYDEGRPRH
jgi:hypothetical protein